MLAACAGGLRRLLLERGEQPSARPLRAIVPVEVRTDAEHHALGSRNNSLFVELPVDEPVAAVRFARIAARARRLKAGPALRGPTTGLGSGALTPPLVTEATIARTSFSTPLFDVTITTVPGPPEPLYAFGARLREVLPVVPLADRHAVGMAICSYNGMVSIGLGTDQESVPDLDVLVAGIDDRSTSCAASWRAPRPLSATERRRRRWRRASR